jgi:uncharacterized protein with HEPN domain
MAATQSPRVRLPHIRDEIDGVTAALQGSTFESYRTSYALRRTAERAVQIISEAARVLPADLTAKHSAAPWSAIIGIGNVLRHEYQSIDDRRMWDIVTVHLPPLRGVVVQMLAELDLDSGRSG